MSRFKSFDERFEAAIERGDGCWEWRGARTAAGYGEIHKGGKQRLAHGLSYERFVGPIPPGNVICHRCDNPGCVRPDHLFAGTQADNMVDMYAKGRGWLSTAPHRRARGSRIGTA